MSNVCHLVVVLVYLFSHACDARQLGIIDGEAAKMFHLPNKEKEKSRLNVRVLDPSSREENIDKVHQAGRAHDQLIRGGHGVVKSSGASHESMVSVSWKVAPHKRKGEQQPGFNLDYSPPKTHPPVHN